MIKKTILFVALLLGVQIALWAEGDGFGETCGGNYGDSVTVTDAATFQTYASSSNPYIIKVVGTIDLGTSGVKVASNKTIVGADTTASIVGQVKISGSKNVIVKYLNISNAYDDGITIRDAASYIYVTHCTVFDCSDGCIDVTVESDFVTISYCRFYYENILVHKFVNLIGASDDNITDRGKLHVTMHNNWWDKSCDCRMPRVRYGRVHVYNNYFSCADNSYASCARIEAEILSEYNYYENVRDPLTIEDGGYAKNNGNVYDNCLGTIYEANDDVFTPSYSYTLESASGARTEALGNAGNRYNEPAPANKKKETVITWTNPSAIIYGTPITATQLNAKATGNTSTPVYSLSLDTVLSEGFHTVTVTFPEDDNYKAASKTVTIEVDWEYFSLTLHATDEADTSLITISPEGTLDDGVLLYPKGTIVTLTASSTPLKIFEYWSDGDTSSTKSITINENTEITASFKHLTYIVGWDFYVEGNSNRAADYYSSDENQTSTFNLYDENGSNLSWILYSGTSTAQWFDKYAAIIWKSKTHVDDYYFQMNFNSKNFEDIYLQVSMLGIYTYYQVQNIEYSTDGTDFNKIGYFNLEQDSVWYTNTFQLPDNANHCDSVIIRFKADNTSTLISTKGIIGTSISDIYVYATQNSDYNSVAVQGKNSHGQIIDKRYYTVDGKRVGNPVKGVNIVHLQYEDGSVAVKKMVFKGN